MASLHTSAPASHSIGAFRRPSAVLHAFSLIFITPGRHNRQVHLHSRCKREVRVLLKKSWSALSVSHANPSEGSDDKKTSDAASGPPFLTVLAGLVVFLVICWIMGSIVTWLIGLIVRPPALK